VIVWFLVDVQVPLLAAATHDGAPVPGQVEVGAKSGEIPMFAPLLDTLAGVGVELARTVITADALHFKILKLA
jgi:hypothetical protein